MNKTTTLNQTFIAVERTKPNEFDGKSTFRIRYERTEYMSLYHLKEKEEIHTYDTKSTWA